MMNYVLSPFLSKFVIVYLDDVLIFSNSMEEHRKHLKLVFDALRKHLLYCKMSKCQFANTSVWYLGYIVENGCSKPDPSKISKI